MANPFETVEHDEWEGDEVEKEDDLPDPSLIFVPSEFNEDNDVAP